MKLSRRVVALFLFFSLLMSASLVAAQDDDSNEEGDDVEMVEEMAETETGEIASDTYVIQPGDTLYSIATSYGLTTDELAELNGIVNPALIFWGTTLNIPAGTGGPVVTPEPTEAPDDSDDADDTDDDSDDEDMDDGEEMNTYTVQAGDNLYRIALANETTVQALVDVNEIADANIIFVGQMLLLPEAAD